MDVLAEEAEHDLVPDQRVLGLEDPVVLVGEVQEPVRALALLVGREPRLAEQLPPQAQALADQMVATATLVCFASVGCMVSPSRRAVLATARVG